jgi:hypothetical protein
LQARSAIWDDRAKPDSDAKRFIAVPVAACGLIAAAFAPGGPRLFVGATGAAHAGCYSRITKPTSRGWLRFIYGGADVGGYLARHRKVDSVHMTGSAATYDAIVWGTDDQAATRKANKHTDTGQADHRRTRRGQPVLAASRLTDLALNARAVITEVGKTRARSDGKCRRGQRALIHQGPFVTRSGSADTYQKTNTRSHPADATSTSW